jgi:DUF2075 family protein
LWLTNDLQDNQYGFFGYKTNQSKSIQQIIVNQKEGKRKIMATMNYMYRYLTYKTNTFQDTEAKATWNMKKREEGGLFFS